VIVLLSIVEVRRITVSVVVQVLNTFKCFNMNETKKVFFFSMLPVSRRALHYWKVTDFALCPSDGSSLKMKMIVGTCTVLLTVKTALFDEKCFPTLPLQL